MDIERKWNSESGNQPSKLLTNRKQGNLDSEKLRVPLHSTTLCVGKLATYILKSLETGSTQIYDISEIEDSTKTGQSEIRPKTDLSVGFRNRDMHSRGPIRSRDRERAIKAYLSRQI